MIYFLTVQISVDAWLWSTVFHTRDLVWTEVRFLELYKVSRNLFSLLSLFFHNLAKRKIVNASMISNMFFFIWRH